MLRESIISFFIGICQRQDVCDSFDLLSASLEHARLKAGQAL